MSCLTLGAATVVAVPTLWRLGASTSDFQGWALISLGLGLVAMSSTLAGDFESGRQGATVSLAVGMVTLLAILAAVLSIGLAVTLNPGWVGLFSPPSWNAMALLLLAGVELGYVAVKLRWIRLEGLERRSDFAQNRQLRKIVFVPIAGSALALVICAETLGIGLVNLGWDISRMFAAPILSLGVGLLLMSCYLAWAYTRNYRANHGGGDTNAQRWGTGLLASALGALVFGIAVQVILFLVIQGQHVGYYLPLVPSGAVVIVTGTYWILTSIPPIDSSLADAPDRTRLYLGISIMILSGAGIGSGIWLLSNIGYPTHNGPIAYLSSIVLGNAAFLILGGYIAETSKHP